MKKELSVLYVEIAVILVAVAGGFLYILLSLVQVGRQEALDSCTGSGYSIEYCKTILD